MQPRISKAAFEVLVAQADLPLNAAQMQEIHLAYGLLEAMQLIAKPFAEPLLFQAAHAYETMTD